MKNIQKIINNLSSKVDIKNPRTITLIAAAVIIIFAILYVYQSRRLLEGFTSYYITGANDTVNLGSLNNVKVSGMELMDAITRDSKFNTEVARKLTETVNNGSLITNDDLNNILGIYDSSLVVTNKINSSLGNYLKKADIANSSELATLIQSKINTYNTQAQAYVNAQVQQTIPNINAQIQSLTNNMTSLTNSVTSLTNNITGMQNLLGIIECYPRNSGVVWSAYNNYTSNTGNYYLGKKSNTSTAEAFICPLSSFNTSYFNKSITRNNEFLRPNNEADWPSIICYFDWMYSHNIFYNRVANVTDNVNFSYVYPNTLNSNGDYISPFPTIELETNSKYLVTITYALRSDVAYSCQLFYVLFNGTESNYTCTPKYISRRVGVKPSNSTNVEINYIDYTNTFVIETQANTFNIGIYLVGTNGLYGSYLQYDWRNHSNVTIYKLKSLLTPTTTNSA